MSGPDGAPISVPKGGGALAAMGETFQPDLHTGTGNLTVPIPLPAGRRRLTPSLSLAYSTGAGNGPFGLGWALNVPRVSRRTDRGIPRYDDTIDTFVLSGAEELVPVPAGSAAPAPGPAGVTVTRYRPRTEAGFVRITHITGDAGDYWDVRSADGLRSHYGTARPAGAPPGWADPAVVANPAGIFTWLLTETADPLGNRIIYGYRADPAGGPQRYLREIRYADYGDPANPSYLVSVRIIYQDEDPGDPSQRPDPFSDRRPGFDLRTTLRAKRIEIWTQADAPVKATTVNLGYVDETGPAPGNRLSLLSRVQVGGHDGGNEQLQPPLQFAYSDWNPAARRFQPLPTELPPTPLGTGGLELADLFGDGLPSWLQLNGTARYWRNRGDGRFDQPRSMTATPAGAALDQPGTQLTDLNGDGRAELVISSATRTAAWSLAAPGDIPEARAGFDPASYTARPAPAFPLTDPQVRLLDLDGDHQADLLYAGTAPLMAFGDGHGGFTGLQRLPASSQLPTLDFTDPRVQFADMTGDGLTDIVLIHNRAVTYWPNLGYGRFGPPVTMADPPAFTDAASFTRAGFDPRRLLLGDVAGDGTADVLYVGDGKVTVWANQSGNGFAAPMVIRGTPRTSDLTQVRLADLNGAGVAGIVWSGTGRDNRAAFLDLTGGTKPYLLTGIDNHAGATTAITYATSTAYATSDRSAGRPWRTTLPFPVHVVASITTRDAFAGTVLSTAFSYHDGYWDPGDREFRGFARVEQTDTLRPDRRIPPAPAKVASIDPLARPAPVPTGFDPAAAGNLLANFSFDTPAAAGPSTLTTPSGQPSGGGQSAAERWTTWNNAATTTATELVPSTLPYGRSGSMIHVTTAGARCGIVQTFLPEHTGPAHVVSSVWIYVVRGSVMIGTGDGGNIAVDAVCSDTGQWMLVEAGNQRSPGNELVIYSASADGAEFFADHAWVRASLGPAEPVDSPPVRTVTWFHPGPVGPPQGDWKELDFTEQYWPGDPPLAPHADYSSLPGRLARPALREAVRAMRGLALRTETYADDGTLRADRPYEVHDFAYRVAPVLDGRSLGDPAWQAQPVATVRPTLSRSAVWERGTDPMTRLQLTGGYDDYGRPHASADIGVPRGRDPRNPGAPCLATLTTTGYATRDDAGLYITDRVARTARHECADDGTQPVLGFTQAVLTGAATSSLRGLELTYYDGPAFTGLGPGLLGNHGLPVRTEHLVITPDLLAGACQPGPGGTGMAVPPYLPTDGSPAPTGWPAEYPAAFQQAIAAAPDARGPHLGYRWHPGSADHTVGYYAQTTRRCYDVQAPHDSTQPRGLVTVTRDAYGGDTAIGYDPYQLLPLSVTDPVGLTSTASYDYRILKPNLVTDPNGNRTAVGYTPLGLPAFTARLGKDGASQGDALDQPSISYDYRLTAWDDSAPTAAIPDGARQPMSVTTVRRVEYRWAIIEQENARRAVAGQPPLTDPEIAALVGPDEPDRHPERFLRTVEFSDGFGRLLQTRTQADELVVDDLGLADGPATPAGPVAAHLGTANSPPVTVNRWTVYDNKGRPTASYEPFAGTGYSYQPPSEQQVAALARTVRHYDPRGLCVRTVAPDGSETLTVSGIPATLADPGGAAPTAWETYTYDANDNAGRTHPTVSLQFADHWNTPASTLLDAFGRTVIAADRTATDTLVTATSYDIDGNLLIVTDPLGRKCADTVYDLGGQPWRTWLLDAGTTHTIRDATGALVEQRDDRTAITLAAHDPAHRPRYGWAADRAGQAPTLRTVTAYGDDPVDAALTGDQARDANALGRVVLTLDEAGQVTTTGYDLDGNPLTVTRRILRPDVLLSTLPASGSTGGWTGTSYPVNWEPAAAETVTAHANALLDLTDYQTDSRWDALGRITSQTAPTDAVGARSRFDFTYGRGGGVIAITLDSAPYLQTASYDPHGRRLFARLGNGLLIRYLYNPHTFRLARLHTAHATQPTPTGWQPAGPVLQDHIYRYDPIGNLLTLADRTPGCGIPPGNPDALDRQFSYDPLYRLTFATGRETDLIPDQPWLDTPRSQDLTRARPYTENYGYDPAGNLHTLQHSTSTVGAYTRTYTPADGTNQLATLTVGSLTADYSYDSCGNMTAETTSRLFEWNHANRLASFRVQAGVAQPSQYAQYRYDGSGTRVLKLTRTQTGEKTITIYLNSFERIIRTTGGPTTIHDTLHITDGATRLALNRRGDPLPGDPMPPTVYHLSDHLGSIAVVTDSIGALLNKEEYTPYGETSFGSYARKRYRFAAKERDEQSGLYYHGARYYACWLARWTSTDPLPKPSQCSYRFAANNPLRIVDPSGAVETLAQLPSGTAAPSVTGTVGEAGAPLAASSGEGAVATGFQDYVPEPLSGAGAAEGEVALTEVGGEALGETLVSGASRFLGTVFMALPLVFISSDEGPPRPRDIEPRQAPGSPGQPMKMPGLPTGPRLELPPYAQGVFDLPGSPMKMPIRDPLLPPSPMELSKERDFGIAFHKMVESIQEKGAYGDWHLWKQNERMPGGPLVRPDEVWVNPKTGEFFIADIYTGGRKDVETPGGAESQAHADKAVGYVTHPAVRALIELGYKFLGYTAIIRRFWQQPEHMH